MGISYPWYRRPPHRSWNNFSQKMALLKRAARKAGVKSRLASPVQRRNPPSRNTEIFVRLNAEAPARMPEAIGDRRRVIGGALGSIHRLQQEMVESEILEALGPGTLLRIDEL